LPASPDPNGTVMMAVTTMCALMTFWHKESLGMCL